MTGGAVASQTRRPTEALPHNHTMKNAVAAGCLVAFTGLLASGSACGKGGANQRSGAASVDSFKVALLTPGPISDQSWNGGAYQGLLRIRDSLGAQISHIQTATPADFDENFRQYGAQGYQLVFGHGFEFQDAAKRVAPEFPHTIYVTTSGTTSGPQPRRDDIRICRRIVPRRNCRSVVDENGQARRSRWNGVAASRRKFSRV